MSNVHIITEPGGASSTPVTTGSGCGSLATPHGSRHAATTTLSSHLWLAGLAALLLGSCVAVSRHPVASSKPPAPAEQTSSAAAQPGSQRLQGHAGHPFDVQADDSLLTVLAFRGGPLGKAGHNHVIASHDIRGSIYVPDDIARTTFELHLPVAQLTVDEPSLRAQAGPDFPTDVPESAREGTRRNMLGEALLNAAEFPEIILTSERMARTLDDPSSVQVLVNVLVHGQKNSLTVPVHYELQDDQLMVTGARAVRQSELGLTPFSALLGALQVEDQMQVRISIRARRAHPQGAADR